MSFSQASAAPAVATVVAGPAVLGVQVLKGVPVANDAAGAVVLSAQQAMAYTGSVSAVLATGAVLLIAFGTLLVSIGRGPRRSFSFPGYESDPSPS